MLDTAVFILIGMSWKSVFIFSIGGGGGRQEIWLRSSPLHACRALLLQLSPAHYMFTPICTPRQCAFHYFF